MKKNNIKDTLERTVIQEDFCIGCGVCSIVSNKKINVEFDKFSMLKAHVKEELTEEENEKSKKVCPFYNSKSNEDLLGDKLYSDNPHLRKEIGRYISLYAGHVAEDDFREKGSSGGMGSWIITELFKNNYIDKVIHVKSISPSDNDRRVFTYQISESLEDIKDGAKSKYYPIEMSGILDFVRNNESKYLIVGIPCFIKALRLLMNEDEVFRNRIKMCIGLVCGHLKSTRFADLFAWQYGVKPGNLVAIDFRTKLPDYGANNYGVTISCKRQGQVESLITKPISQLYGANWGKGFFKYKSCDYCDDVLAETADVTIGDAWLPQYSEDSKGTNIIIVRNDLIKNIIQKGIESDALKLDILDENTIIESQQGGFTHRHEELAYRLYLYDKTNKWRPQKRIKPSDNLPSKRKKIQILRMELAKRSHIAFNEAVRLNDFNAFKEKLKPIEKEYDKLYLGSFLKRAIRKLLKIIKIK